MTIPPGDSGRSTRLVSLIGIGVTALLAAGGLYGALRSHDEDTSKELVRQAQAIVDIEKTIDRDRQDTATFRDEMRAALNRIAERCPIPAPARPLQPR